MLENLVQLGPREERGESIGRTAAEERLLLPVVREELVHRHGGEQSGQPGPGIVSRIHSGLAWEQPVLRREVLVRVTWPSLVFDPDHTLGDLGQVAVDLQLGLLVGLACRRLA